MIGYLEGTLLDLGSQSCILRTPGGVGYEVRLIGSVALRPPAQGEGVTLFVKTVVKEDAIDLYGFGSREERDTFELLLSVSKLGPKTASAILAAYEPAALADVVLREDVKAMSRVHGIGPKSAKRILWELKDRFTFQDTGAAGSVRLEADRPGTVYADALAALVNLGYDDLEVRTLLAKVLEDDPELETGEAIRATLKTIAGTRS